MFFSIQRKQKGNELDETTSKFKEKLDSLGRNEQHGT